MIKQLYNSVINRINSNPNESAFWVQRVINAPEGFEDLLRLNKIPFTGTIDTGIDITPSVPRHQYDLL